MSEAAFSSPSTAPDRDDGYCGQWPRLLRPLIDHRTVLELEQPALLTGGQLCSTTARRRRQCGRVTTLGPIIPAIISSIVPVQKNLRTWEARRCPDPECPVGRLVLDGRVPPAVDVHDVVGGGEGQPGPPAFRDSTNSAGAATSSVGKRVTISSRSALGTPPLVPCRRGGCGSVGHGHRRVVVPSGLQRSACRTPTS